jgi:hypothetical protein
MNRVTTSAVAKSGGTPLLRFQLDGSTCEWYFTLPQFVPRQCGTIRAQRKLRGSKGNLKRGSDRTASNFQLRRNYNSMMELADG